MLGMTLALRLSQARQKVTLLEARPHLGGLADSWTLGEVRWDRHYHVTLLSDSQLRALLAELQLDQELRWVCTQTGFFVDGKTFSLSNAWDFLRFPVLSPWSKLRLAQTILMASRIRDGQSLEQLPCETWLRRWSGEAAWHKFWQPLLRAKLGENTAYASAAFIWATIARLYAARRTGLKREMFGYLPGGYARTLERFEQLLRERDVEIVTGCPVQEVRSDPEGLRLRIDSGDRIFDRVILTLHSPLIPQVCPQLTPQELHAHAAIRYQGILCASLLLPRPLSPYYVTNVADAECPFTGVIEMTALVDPRELRGRHLVYLPRYVPSESAAFDDSDQQIRDSFLSGLRRIHPSLSDSEVLAFRVSRARHVMPIPTLDYSRNLPPLQTSIPGLYVVNAAQIVNGTLNVNETVTLANRATGQILAWDCDLSRDTKKRHSAVPPLNRSCL